MEKRGKYAVRQAAIIDAASMLLNREGAHSLRMSDVAEQLGLDTSSLNYYFRKKDELIAACLERSILWLENATGDAARADTPAARADQLLARHFELFAAQRHGGETLALLSDLPSLVDEERAPLEEHLDAAMRTIGAYFPTGESRTRVQQLLAANALASTIFWLPAWQQEHAEADFDRVRKQIVAFFSRGLLCDAPKFGQHDLIGAHIEDEARGAFLDAATRLINRHGHKGARVEQVAAELGLSTGSFYHHLRTKNELVVACFERSFRIFDEALELAMREPTGAAVLARLTRSIAHFQLTSPAPLLRIGSYQALPADLRQPMYLLSVRLKNRISGIVAQGIADGSIRSCDPSLAAQYYLAVVYGYSDLRDWSRPSQSKRLVEGLEQFLHTGIGNE